MVMPRPAGLVVLILAVLAATAPAALGQSQEVTVEDALNARDEANAVIEGLRDRDLGVETREVRRQIEVLASEWERGNAFLQSHAALTLEFDRFTRRRQTVESGCLDLSRDMEQLAGNPFARSMPLRVEQCWQTMEWANQVYAGYSRYLRQMRWFVDQARGALETNRGQDEILRQQLDLLDQDMFRLQDETDRALDSFLGRTS